MTISNGLSKISIVILTYNRRDRLIYQMNLLKKLTISSIEIVVVDNASDEAVDDLVAQDSRIIYVRNDENLGAVGRNRGIEVATGDIIITLDDDVYGITDQHIDKLHQLFNCPELGAVVFRVEEESTGKIMNWCHPYDQDSSGDKSFETNDISEGAVAFRANAIKQVGLYPEYFFMSHEGPDLAFRMINKGWRLIYTPDIKVIHAYDQRNRPNWRRYYFDTRNHLWLVLRNLSFSYGLKRLFIGWGSMLVYSIRDGYVRYWFKAVRDALVGAPRAWRDRCEPTAETKKRWRKIERFKPSAWQMARKRLFKKGVRI